MSVVLTPDGSTWKTGVIAPTNGTAADADEIKAGLQKLTDRTEWLKLNPGGGGGGPAMGGDISGTASTSVVESLSPTSGKLNINATTLTSANQHEAEETATIAGSAGARLCAIALPNNNGCLRATGEVVIFQGGGGSVTFKLDSARIANAMGAAYNSLDTDTQAAKPTGSAHTAYIEWGAPGGSDACRIYVQNGSGLAVKVAAVLHVLRVNN